MFVTSIAMIVGMAYAVYRIIRDGRRERDFFQVTVPQQLVNLVRQAHAGDAFSTVWNISVGADMRERLCYPLTSEQVEIIKNTLEPDEKHFAYTLQSYTYDGSGISGTVLVTIRYRDNEHNLDLSYTDVPIHISCGGKKGGLGWKVESVDYS